MACDMAYSHHDAGIPTRYGEQVIAVFLLLISRLHHPPPLSLSLSLSFSLQRVALFLSSIPCIALTSFFVPPAQSFLHLNTWFHLTCKMHRESGFHSHVLDPCILLLTLETPESPLCPEAFNFFLADPRARHIPYYAEKKTEMRSVNFNFSHRIWSLHVETCRWLVFGHLAQEILLNFN